MESEEAKTEQAVQETPKIGQTITLVFKSGAVVKVNNVMIAEQAHTGPNSVPMSSGLLIMRAVNGDPPRPYKPLLYSFDKDGRYSITELAGQGPQGPIYSTTYLTPNALLDALIFE